MLAQRYQKKMLKCDKNSYIGDSTSNACHHMVYTGRPSMKD